MRSWLVGLAAALLIGLPAALWWHRRGAPAPEPGAAVVSSRDAARVRLEPQPIGELADPAQPPMIAHLAAVDLDQDGLLDAIACDAANHRVTWIRQSPAGVFTEIPLGETIRAPAHAAVVDFDGDGHLDIVVASLGILFPNNDPIGSVVLLRNDGQQRFTHQVLLENVARCADARAADLNGNGLPDIAVAQFGYDDGETRWMENLGDGTFRSHILQRLPGGINVEVADMDGNGTPDLVVLISQEYEEVYVFANDGRGNFTPHLIYGSTNADFGSSGISVVDFNGNGRPDVLYSNGDAFDYTPPRPRPWHGVQWLENLGELKFQYHRIGDLPGAFSPRAVDLNGNGHLDVVAVSAFAQWERPDAGSLIWFENDGRMNLTRHTLATAPTHQITVAVGDFDGDGRPDLISGGMHIFPPYDRLGRVTLWLNRTPIPPAPATLGRRSP